MPFEIVRNDIVKMQVDAIVNTANPFPEIGSGVDTAIHTAAGTKLLQARKKVGNIARGDAAITPAFDLTAKYVIHTVGPIWEGGKAGEVECLRSCYQRSLELALKNGCTSIAFPLLATGNYGFPKDQALQVAVSTISNFLLQHEMMVYLVVFTDKAFTLSEKLFSAVQSYIDEHYVAEKIEEEYYTKALPTEALLERRMIRERRERLKEEKFSAALDIMPDFAVGCDSISLEELLKEEEMTFSEALLDWLIRKDLKDSDVYKKANIDRKLFSKIRNNPDYKPKKNTAIAFALAMELDLEETKEFIGRAGYALTHSSKYDIIIEYFIRQKNYNVFEINEVLFAYNYPLIGA
ncbi:MAG: macro domain-containing protein [Anaerotignum sp.]|nr:macro domain-containing protein [Anaerotignum sp.]